MAQRVIKILLPKEYENFAYKILENQSETVFWQEEAAENDLVISALTDVDKSEAIMDLFDKRFSTIEGFRLIVFPVAATLPRPETPTTEAEEVESDKDKKVYQSLRVSREELYTNIVDSAKLSSVFVFLTCLSTIVAAIGLLQNSVAVIIGAMVIAPFLGPNVALAFATCLADKELAINALKTLFTGIIITFIFTTTIGFSWRWTLIPQKFFQEPVQAIQIFV